MHRAGAVLGLCASRDGAAEDGAGVVCLDNMELFRGVCAGVREDKDKRDRGDLGSGPGRRPILDLCERRLIGETARFVQKPGCSLPPPSFSSTATTAADTESLSVPPSICLASSRCEALVSCTMDTAQHYSNLVYHLQTPVPPLAPHAISNSAPRQPLPHDMSWQPPQHPQLSASASASPVHAQMPLTMSQSQNHVEYATPSAPQQSYMSHHIPGTPTSLPSSSAVEPGSSSQALSFDSPQVESSIGPDRGISRRRFRLHERVPSHGELPEYEAMRHHLVRPVFLLYAPLC